MIRAFGISLALTFAQFTSAQDITNWADTKTWLDENTEGITAKQGLNWIE